MIVSKEKYSMSKQKKYWQQSKKIYENILKPVTNKTCFTTIFKHSTDDK